mmetsp:Transcript_46735/g.117711  ORF Transcript_46735/g.117711 Transcript_46735/m.117711 type:complete len:314 (+) Transcript_46735:45-986(+)|eukprot:CAMPEP_0115467344 /NCGR_PEP_ID=MMETSP0271-20121206/50391_1 /TAXON_ID=71861 /ORGANISM="Scrippsiella trochoidea, Strain CCMP3099" /LENGTH=313 /DNA_ID=CAMNT_0002894359 /DNA_START=45 /DNA_END=986 /DNA_ORIENTATION=+
MSRPEPSLLHVPTACGALALWDWCASGTKESNIVLIHAAGLHARCWDEVVRRLPVTFRCICIDMFGHGRSDTPAVEQVNWRPMASALLAALAAVGLEPQDVAVLAGHSMGGWICAVAAALSLQPFPGLLLIDPVIQPLDKYGPPFTSESDRWAQVVRQMTERRRDAFEGPADMFERFKGRQPYAVWHPQVLRDYCDHGLSAPSSGRESSWRLLCRPALEASLYPAASRWDAEISQELAVLAQRRQPVTILRAPSIEGGQPFEGSQTDPALAARLGSGAVDIFMEHVNHFIPMTHPDEIAKHLQRLASPARSCL